MGRTDHFESEGFYYDRITVPVVVHRQGQEDEQKTAQVYKMTEKRIQDEIKRDRDHNDDEYVEACALSDKMHYVLLG